MYSVELVDGKAFSAEDGETLLDAASRSCVDLNYSCKSGRCNACKCKVLNGSTKSLRPEAGLTEDEKNGGWILACVRTAESDLLLDAIELGTLLLPRPKIVPCRISQINRLAPDVIQVLLRLPPTAEFNYLPGQYIDVTGPGNISRSYSLANAYSKDEVLELHIRKVEDGAMSHYWFNQAKVDDLLRLNGPLGTFFLREFAGVNLIFMATGTGIAPIKAMLESMVNLSKEQSSKSVTVLWGGRKLQDIYFDLGSIPGDHEFIPVLSQPDEGWSGKEGYVQDVLLSMNQNLENTAVYACGSDAMIYDAKERLLSAGLLPGRFYSDAFVCTGSN